MLRRFCLALLLAAFSLTLLSAKPVFSETAKAPTKQVERKLIAEAVDSEALKRLGATHFLQNQYEEAAEAFKKAIRLRPDDAEAHMGLGEAYQELGRWQDAVEVYKEAVRLKPNDAEPRLGLGITYGNFGRWEDAVAALDEATRLKPDYALAHHQLGVAYFFLGNHQGVADEYKILKELDRDLANNLLELIPKEKGPK